MAITLQILLARPTRRRWLARMGFAMLTLLGWGATSRRSLALNRLLFDKKEVITAPTGGCRVRIPLADSRAEHVARVLQLRDGDTCRVGILGGIADNRAEVRWIWPEGSKGEWAQNESRELRRARLELDDMTQALEREEELPQALELSFSNSAEDALSPPRVDLLLAPASYDNVKKLLPEISQLGVGTLVMCEAKGADKRLLGTNLLQSPQKLREMLVQGLVQSGDTWIPKVALSTSLGKLLEPGGLLDKLCPREGSLRLAGATFGKRIMEFKANRPAASQPRVLVAVGPLGGWRGDSEKQMLSDAGFRPLCLGKEAKSQEVQTCAAISLAAALVRSWDAVDGALTN